MRKTPKFFCGFSPLKSPRAIRVLQERIKTPPLFYFTPSTPRRYILGGGVERLGKSMRLQSKLFLRPLGRANSTRGDRLEKLMGLFFLPFLKPIGRANSAWGQPSVLQSAAKRRWVLSHSGCFQGVLPYSLCGYPLCTLLSMSLMLLASGLCETSCLAEHGWIAKRTLSLFARMRHHLEKHSNHRTVRCGVEIASELARSGQSRK